MVSPLELLEAGTYANKPEHMQISQNHNSTDIFIFFDDSYNVLYYAATIKSCNSKNTTRCPLIDESAFIRFR